MVISPVLRGMFGLAWNAADHSLSVTPHLPANWDHATLRRLPLGDSSVDLTFTRRGQEMLLEASGPAASGLHLSSLAVGAKLSGAVLHIPLPAVEVRIKEELPPFGAETRQMKVIDEESAPHRLTLTLAAQGGSEQKLWVRENATGISVHADDAKIGAAADVLRELEVKFPDGPGYVTETVTLTW
jgi:hypothetical protein